MTIKRPRSITLASSVNTKELGKLNVTGTQEDAIVACLKTLSDGYITP